MSVGNPADTRRILLARGLRAFGDGYVAILLPVHLSSLGFDALAVGAISTATLLGSSLLALGLGAVGHRIRRRPALLAASLLMAASGFAFGVLDSFWPLLLIAFVGTLSPTGGDVGVFLPLEHTVLTQSVPAERRTAAFARYSFVGSMVGALGALAAGAVDWLGSIASARTIADALFLLYGGLGLASFALYRSLSPRAEAPGDAPPAPLGPSRRRVYGLAALFSLDSFGGGFVVNSLLALWLSERFGLDVAAVGTIFFVTSLCSAVSYFAAVPLAARFGLVNTMVFTHLPSSVFLILVAFAPDATVTFGLLVLRALLSQMDVPTRSSYVMAVVEPHERPAAASITAVPRGFAAALSPLISGWLMGLSPFGWPLIFAGALKITYDLLLLQAFSQVRPPEEVARRAPQGGLRDAGGR
ncbi:MFS transporter [Sabulicella rubraurantiaca]|uniref:MFS transporter n=1 Tax=Sabulicella rubraurantiaca TaxID=2811429 RepID=UPI001A95E682|nr:MFS transporter [Sabulicella rubraurantiaca]